MSLPFQIEASWLPSDTGTPEERALAAELRITLGDEVLTTVQDYWANTVRDRVRLSAWPLAMWLASSWWRLRWEAASDRSASSSSFLSSHEMSAVGSGFVWPRISFRTDGEMVEIRSRPSRRGLGEPVRYLAEFAQSVRAEQFEAALRNFIVVVLARLDSEGIRRSALHELWAEIAAEEADDDLREYRRMEARLGFDPDEGKPDVVGAFLDLEEQIGAGAASELANMGVMRDPLADLKRLRSLSKQQSGATVSFEWLRGRGDTQLAGGKYPTPADRGRALARNLRESLRAPPGPFDDARLSSLLGSDSWKSSPPQRDIPVALGVIQDGVSRLFFRRQGATGRRFEAARFIGDFLIRYESDRWLPATDAETARQKVQRAFAAEFLAPIEAIKARLGADLSDAAISDVADEFGVSSLVVWSSLANDGVISPDQVPRVGGVPAAR